MERNSVVLLLLCTINTSVAFGMNQEKRYNHHGALIEVKEGIKIVSLPAKNELFKYLKKTKSFEDLVDVNLYSGSAKAKHVPYFYVDNTDKKEGRFIVPAGLEINKDNECTYSMNEDKYEEYHLFAHKGDKEQMQIGSTMAFWHRMKENEIKLAQEMEKNNKNNNNNSESWYSNLLTVQNVKNVAIFAWEHKKEIQDFSGNAKDFATNFFSKKVEDEGWKEVIMNSFTKKVKKKTSSCSCQIL